MAVIGTVFNVKPLAMVTVAVAVLVAPPNGRADTHAIDGAYVPLGDPKACNDPSFVIEGETIRFGAFEPWDALVEADQVTPIAPAGCVECVTTPFTINADGALERMEEGLLYQFERCG